MDIFNIVIISIILFLCGQYNLHIFSTIIVLAYSIYNRTISNLLLVLVLALTLFLFPNSIANYSLMILIILGLLIIVLHLFKPKKKEASADGFADFSKLFNT